MQDDVMQNSRNFYEKKVAPMIHEKFPEYESRIAAGLVGEGSDCFGYYDTISRDHDFGTGVCLFLDEEDYNNIGKQLIVAYNDVAYTDGDHGLTKRLKERRGVLSIHGFYSGILNVDCDIDKCELSLDQWRSLDHSCLATACNGVVFRDDLGKFTAFREYLLKHYPEKIYKERLAQEIHNFAMALQVNYARCMSRRDFVAAGICKNKGIEAAMQIFFLLNKKYPPYYKWTFRALKDLDTSNGITYLLEKMALAEIKPEVWDNYKLVQGELNTSDQIVVLTEKIATYLVKQLRLKGFTENRDPYLERYVNEVLYK